MASKTLLRCTRRYLAALEAEADVVVLDALLPFIGSLLGWGVPQEEISDFVDDLAGALDALGCETIFVYLDGGPSVALDRAITREADTGWMDWLIGTLRNASGPPVVDRPTLEQFLQRRRDLTTNLLSEPGRPWTFRVVPDAVRRSPVDVLEAVQGALKGRMPRSSVRKGAADLRVCGC